MQHPKTDKAEGIAEATEKNASAPVEKSITEQITDAESEVDALLTQLNTADKAMEECRKTRSDISKKHRSALNKLVTLESIKRTK